MKMFADINMKCDQIYVHQVSI